MQFRASPSFCLPCQIYRPPDTIWHRLNLVKKIHASLNTARDLIRCREQLPKLDKKIMQLPATLRDGISLEERTGRKRACGVHFPLAMSLKGTPILGLQIVILLAIVGGRVVGQNSGDDTMCLTGFKASLQDNVGALAQWTPVQLASPCNTSAAPLNGIVCQNDRINSINLRGTNLMGSISPSLANCSNLQTLDLSANQLSGPIPTNLGNLSYLTTLNFSKNQLTGFIPLELSACIYLNVIDLHQNQLTGAIPAQLGYLSRLKAFDVSDNQLSGPVPTTLSNTSNGSPRFNSTSFLGNKGLYGYPLPPLKTHNLSVLAILGIGLGSGLVSLVVSFTAVCIWLRVTEQGYAAEEGKISQLMSES